MSNEDFAASKSFVSPFFASRGHEASETIASDIFVLTHSYSLSQYGKPSVQFMSNENFPASESFISSFFASPGHEASETITSGIFVLTHSYSRSQYKKPSLVFISAEITLTSELIISRLSKSRINEPSNNFAKTSHFAVSHSFESAVYDHSVTFFSDILRSTSRPSLGSQLFVTNSYTISDVFSNSRRKFDREPAIVQFDLRTTSAQTYDPLSKIITFASPSFLPPRGDSESSLITQRSDLRTSGIDIGSRRSTPSPVGSVWRSIHFAKTTAFKRSFGDRENSHALENGGGVIESSALWVGLGVALFVFALIVALVVRFALARSRTTKSEMREDGMEVDLETDEEKEQSRFSISDFGSGSLEKWDDVSIAPGLWADPLWQLDGNAFEEVNF
jgi:hypothetical protein